MWYRHRKEPSDSPLKSGRLLRALTNCLMMAGVSSGVSTRVLSVVETTTGLGPTGVHDSKRVDGSESWGLGTAEAEVCHVLGSAKLCFESSHWGVSGWGGDGTGTNTGPESFIVVDVKCEMFYGSKDIMVKHKIPAARGYGSRSQRACFPHCFASRTASAPTVSGSATTIPMASDRSTTST